MAQTNSLKSQKRRRNIKHRVAARRRLRELRGASPSPAPTPTTITTGEG